MVRPVPTDNLDRCIELSWQSTRSKVIVNADYITNTTWGKQTTFRAFVWTRARFASSMVVVAFVMRWKESLLLRHETDIACFSNYLSSKRQHHVIISFASECSNRAICLTDTLDDRAVAAS
jgi:hypothetical protein